MADTVPSNDMEKDRVMLGLLESVAQDGSQSQRRLAGDLGVALGLVNAYLRRCVKKGLVKVKEAPARRYAYYLTPRGFSEKSRLTVEYLSYSLTFVREARLSCSLAVVEAKALGHRRIVFAGVSDLADLARISALDVDMTVVAVVDASASVEFHLGLPVVRNYDDVPGAFDGVLVTDMVATGITHDAAVQRVGAEHVFVPQILGVGRSRKSVSKS